MFQVYRKVIQFYIFMCIYIYIYIYIYMYVSEKAMVPHSRTLAWKIPWTEEPGRLQSMGSLRAGHDWSDLAAAVAYMYILIQIIFCYK